MNQFLELIATIEIWTENNPWGTIILSIITVNFIVETISRKIVPRFINVHGKLLRQILRVSDKLLHQILLLPGLLSRGLFKQLSRLNTTHSAAETQLRIVRV